MADTIFTATRSAIAAEDPTEAASMAAEDSMGEGDSTGEGEAMEVAGAAANNGDETSEQKIFYGFMKTSITTILRARSRGATIAACVILGLSACHSGPLNTLTQANLDKIQPDMSSQQVKAILGEPTDSKSEPIPIVGGTKTTYIYSTDKDHVVIVLKNDNVQTKEGTFSAGQ